MSFGERYDSTTKDFMSYLLDKTAEEAGQLSPMSTRPKIEPAVHTADAVQGTPNTADAVQGMLHTADAISPYQKVMHAIDAANEVYGPSWWNWEPETVVATFGYSDLDVLRAYQVLVNTNQAHEHWHVFEKVGHAFNYNVVDFAIVQPLRTDECALTLKIIREIRPKEPFDAEVVGYVACCAKHDGLVYLPGELFGKEFQAALDSLGNDLELKAKVLAGKPVDHPTEIQLKSVEEIRSYAGGKS